MELISRVGTVSYRDRRLETLAGQVAQVVTHVEVEEGDLFPDWLATGGDEVKIQVAWGRGDGVASLGRHLSLIHI